MGTDEAARAFGDFLQSQRRLANISQRQLARASGVSDSYLSQVERGLYRPSAEVLKALAHAFEMPISTMFAQSGLMDAAPEAAPSPSIEAAIRNDTQLNAEQKSALLGVYKAFVAELRGEPHTPLD
jgi:transcriptional regulator with XRE-family HTH domain